MDDLSIRDEIEQIIKQLSINRNDFHEVGKNQWKIILSNIQERFIQKSYHNQNLHWGWESFKEPKFSMSFTNDDGYKYLSNLIVDDLVWFIVEDYKEKFWLYEGKKDIITLIISDCSKVSEYYVVSKKYEWILCENHHSYILGSGLKIVDKMILLNEQKTEKSS